MFLTLEEVTTAHAAGLARGGGGRKNQETQHMEHMEVCIEHMEVIILDHYP